MDGTKKIYRLMRQNENEDKFVVLIFDEKGRADKVLGHFKEMAAKQIYWIDEMEVSDHPAPDRFLDARVAKKLGLDEAPYSSDMNAALKVMLKLDDPTRDEKQQFMGNIGGGTPTYWVEFERRVYIGEPDTFHALGPVAAKAVCVAGLLALRDDDWLQVNHYSDYIQIRE